MPYALALILSITPIIGWLGGSDAFAQGDWGVRRDPFNKQIVGRYKAALRRNPNNKGALRALTSMYKRYRSLKQLVREYHAETKRFPKRFSSLVVLGHLYRQLGDNPRAKKQYEAAAALQPNHSAILIALGDLYKREGQLAKATAAYQSALKGAKGSAKRQLLQLLADLALDADDMATARKYYEQLISLDPKNTRYSLELADALYRNKKYGDAIAVLKALETRVAKDTFRRVEVISKIGQAHEANGNDDAAIAEYRRAMGKIGRTYYLRRELIARVIDIYRRKQKVPELITQYEQQWSTAKRDHFEWSTLAQLYEQTGAQEKALVAYRKAIKKAPHELDTHKRLIQLLENTGREAEALKQYERVAKLAPGESRFQLELAKRYWQLGRQREALNMLKRLGARFSRDPGVHAAMADLYAEWGKKQLALKAHIKLTQIEPEDPQHLENLGEQYFQRNDKARAVAVWKRILRRRTARNYAKLGQVYADHDMLDEAAAMYAKAIKMQPKKPERYKGRALVHERKRRWDLAIADWQRVLELTKPTPANRPMRMEARNRIVDLYHNWSPRQLQRQIAAWRTAFRNPPADVDAGYLLVAAQIKLRLHSDALVTLEALRKANKKDLNALKLSVKVHRDLGPKDFSHYAKAIALLKILIKLDDASMKSQYYYQAAELARFAKDMKAARTYSELALAASPNDASAYEKLAEHYKSTDENAKAIAAYEKAIKLSPRRLTTRLKLAELYKPHNHVLGTPHKAALLYHEVIRRSTNRDLVLKAARQSMAIDEVTGTLGELEKAVAPLAFTYGHTNDVYRRILVEVYARHVLQLVQAKTSDNPKRRAAAEAELQRLGRSAMKPLLEALNDESDPAQQRTAVAVLGHLRNKAAAVPLMRLGLQQDKSPGARRRLILRATLDPSVRMNAIRAAARLADPRVIPHVLTMLKRRDVSLQEAGVYALGLTRDNKALSPLIKQLTGSRPASVQTLACLGLAQLGHPDAINPMVQFMQDSHHADTARAACAFGLGWLGNAKAVGPLAAVLAQGNDEVQRLAAWSLGQLANPRALPPLIEAYYQRHDRLRNVIHWAIATAAQATRPKRPNVNFTLFPVTAGRYDAEQVIASLPGALTAATVPRHVVAKHTTTIESALMNALGRHRDVVLRVLKDLNKQPETLGLGVLSEAFTVPNTSNGRQTNAALIKIARTLVPALVKRGADRDPTVRALSVLALAKIDGAREAPEMINRALEDKARQVRYRALQAAAIYIERSRGGSKRMRARLHAALKSPDWLDRQAAAAAMGHMRTQLAPETLIHILKHDPMVVVRANAAIALGRAGHRVAIPALLDATHHEYAALRLAAVQSLVRLGDKRAHARLKELAASDENERVRRAAGNRKN